MRFCYLLSKQNVSKTGSLKGPPRIHYLSGHQTCPQFTVNIQLLVFKPTHVGIEKPTGLAPCVSKIVTRNVKTKEETYTRMDREKNMEMIHGRGKE